jgi:hypothetical protein
MKPYKIPVGSGVVVVWADAQSMPNWTERELFVNTPLPEVKTIGAWAGSTKEHVAIAQNMSESDECDGIRIPWGWIKSIQLITRTKGE